MDKIEVEKIVEDYLFKNNRGTKFLIKGDNKEMILDIKDCTDTYLAHRLSTLIRILQDKKILEK